MEVDSYFYLGNQYMLSTSVGSGKTRAAIKYMLGGSLATHNFIYVAPTIALVNQTSEELKRKIKQHKGHSRNVNLIHSESNLEMSSFEASLSCLNETQGQIGAVVILTTRTFLTVLPMIQGKRHWHVILDEAFKPLEFLYYKLGKDKEAGKQYFYDLFAVDSKTQRVTPAEGKANLVQAIARRNDDYAGTKYAGMASFAQAVTNQAIRCELVKGSDNWLTMAAYVTPEYFDDFREVVFMAALFDQSILYHLWTRHHEICFREHSFFKNMVKRNVHKSQGKYVSVGHLLHRDDNASRYNLERNSSTGRGCEKTFGKRVIDHAVDTVIQYFKGNPFLLQVNNWTGYERRQNKLPKDSKLIKVNSHGLNCYRDYTCVGSLAVTNPDRWEAEWIISRTGLAEDQMYLAYRVHTVYQAVGRSAIRKGDDTREKVFLTTGYEDARFLHKLFEGSRFLGQIGDLPSLRELAKDNRKPRLQDHPEYSSLRNRRDSLNRKARSKTLSPSEQLELRGVQSRLKDIKQVA